MGFFVLFDLLLQLFFDNIDGGVHVERAFADVQTLVRQMQNDVAGILFLIPGPRHFFEFDNSMGAVAMMAGLGCWLWRRKPFSIQQP